MSAPQETYTRYAQLARVVDGDTVRLDIDLGHGMWIRNTAVRLEGIDTPELNAADPAARARAQEAQLTVHQLLTAAARILVQTRSLDKYGRWLGGIWFQPVEDSEWFDLGAVLLAGGLADPYTK